MNYPVWDLPASGLLIAAVAIVHVFVSHFAIGGGAFLVLAERRSRRTQDAAELAFVRTLSRVFVLLTLVFGALTGVGIWFTIGLVHPAATSSLINAFVWAWAIEWTLFVVEIAAALVYYYGWDRLDARAHLAVGWIYVAAAWLSLVVINGILTFMLTPGRWLVTRSLWDGFFNPTYWPSLVLRTLGAMGLAGLYALTVAAWAPDAALKARVARRAAVGWIAPAALLLPAALAWYLAAAARAGVPVGELFGVSGDGAAALVRALVTGPASGHPVAQRAAGAGMLASLLLLAGTAVVVWGRPRRFGRPAASLLMALGLVTVGSAEWVREDLRKPYVIGRYMFVTGVRLPPPAGAAGSSAVQGPVTDPFTIDALGRSGVLAVSRWARAPETTGDEAERLVASGRRLFTLQCAACHTVDGYLAIRPLVRGRSQAALSGLLARLARPVDPNEQPTGWDHPDLRLDTWRGRRMPPFAGTDDERRALAAYLATLGGAPAAAAAAATLGERYFEEHCGACHGPGGDFPIGGRGRSVEDLAAMIGRLPEINELMPPFEGTDAERRAVAEYLAGLEAPPPKETGR